MPQFCKVDVEGYEYEVLKGLTATIPFLSFEYAVPERLKPIKLCLNELSRIGNFTFNYTIGEEMKLETERWLTPEELTERLSTQKRKIFGDIYVRFETGQAT